jgi:hypothetical protein
MMSEEKKFYVNYYDKANECDVVATIYAENAMDALNFFEMDYSGYAYDIISVSEAS